MPFFVQILEMNGKKKGMGGVYCFAFQPFFACFFLILRSIFFAYTSFAFFNGSDLKNG